MGGLSRFAGWTVALVACALVGCKAPDAGGPVAGGAPTLADVPVGVPTADGSAADGSAGGRADAPADAAGNPSTPSTAPIMVQAEPPPGRQRAVRQRVVVDEGELSYVDLGQGPAVVLIHAGNVDLRLWDDDIVPLLDAGFRVIRYDLRGAGRSTLAVGPFQHQDDLRLLLDHLELPRAALVGASLGGRVALDFAVEHPGRVEALVLLAPGLSGFDWSTQDLSWFEPIWRAMVDGDQEQAARLWLTSPYLTAAMEDPVLAERIQGLVFANAFQWTPSVYELSLAPPASTRLSSIEAPTLLLLGTRDVPGSEAIATLLEDRLPDVDRRELPGAGHLLNLERPAEVHAALIEFLRER